MGRLAPSGVLPNVEDSTPRKNWRPPRLWRFLLRIVRLAVPLFCRLRITGHIPDKIRESSVIVASNHIGLFDPFVLMAACARQGLYPRFLATAGMFKAPIIGPVMRACGHIPVDRGHHTVTQALHRAAEALHEGSCVVLYPEGRITLDPGMWPEKAKTGAARLAHAHNTPITIVAQWGAHEVTAWDQPTAIARTLLTSLIRRPIAQVDFAGTLDLSDLDHTQPGYARTASDRISAATVQTLQRLRANEPTMPRHVDPKRPLSTARTFRRGSPHLTDDA